MLEVQIYLKGLGTMVLVKRPSQAGVFQLPADDGVELSSTVFLCAAVLLAITDLLSHKQTSVKCFSFTSIGCGHGVFFTTIEQ